MSDTGQMKNHPIAEDDPFEELLRFSEDSEKQDASASAADLAPAGEPYAPSALAPVPETPPVSEPTGYQFGAATPAPPPPPANDMPTDLEQALLAELGGGAPEIETGAPEEPAPIMASAPVEPVDTTAAPQAAFDTFEPEPPVAPAAPVEDAVSLEDELAALLNADADDATPAPAPLPTPVEPVAAEPVPSLAGEAPAAEEPVIAQIAPSEPVVEPALAPIEEPEDDYADLEQALAVDLDGVDSAVSSQSVAQEIAESGDMPAEQAVDAIFEEVEADLSAQNAVEATVEEKDPLDELLGIMGDELAMADAEKKALEQAAAELEAAAAPALETQEINLEDELDLSGFDLPADLEQEASAPGAKNTGDWHDDGAMTVVAGSAGGMAGAGAASADLDQGDSFDEARFEAELARDMQFAEHDAQARTDAVSADLQSDFEDADNEAPTEERSQFGLKLAAIVGSIAIVGAVGLFMFGGGSADETSGPVIVEADPEPIKIRPENPGGTEVPNQDRAVFADTNQASEPSQPSLVATSEEPVDLAGLPDADAPKSEERLLPEIRTVDGTTNVPAEDNAITPRRVRTLVVRPDGTLEERPLPEPEPEIEVAVAPAQPEVDVVIGTPATAPAPVAAPETATSGTGTVDFQPPAGGDTATGLTEAETAAITTGTATVPSTEDVPVRRVQTQVFSPNGIPDRPANQPVNIVNPQPAPQQTAAAAPQPAAQPVAAPAAASEFKVQIASLPTQESAQQTSANLLSQFRNVLGGRGVAIREAQIPDRGTFYRVQVDATSLDDANNLCARYRAAGGDCIVTR